MNRTNPNLVSVVYDAKLALLDALIAKAERLQASQSAFALEHKPLAFAYPLASCETWEAFGALVYEQGAVLPADSRWSTPTYVTGPVDPSVAFAVGVGIGEES
jgi:hypothetical protein